MANFFIYLVNLNGWKGKSYKGKIGKDLSVDQGYEAAKRCGLSIISQVKKACNGDLSKIKTCVKLTGYVNSTDDFGEQPKVINGASDLIASILVMLECTQERLLAQIAYH